MSMFPLVMFDEIPLVTANRCLIEWGHKMGPLNRPGGIEGGDRSHGLLFDGQLVGVACTSGLIAPNVAKRPDLVRSNTIELSRLCSSSPHFNRVVLRLWRECVFRPLKHDFAISYQDMDLHTGNTYRFDGWKKIGESRSGTDTRSGRKGRHKAIWLYEAVKTVEPQRELLEATNA